MRIHIYHCLVNGSEILGQDYVGNFLIPALDAVGD